MVMDKKIVSWITQNR